MAVTQCCSISAAISISMILIVHIIILNRSSSSIPLHFYLHSSFLTLSSNHTIPNHLRSLTTTPHLSGTPQALIPTSYLLSHFQALQIPTHLHSFNSILSYPIRSSLSVRFPSGAVVRLATAEPGRSEEVVEAYHAFSPSGEAYGRAVFVNRGSEEDYRELEKVGVGVEGCVVVVRRGGGVSRAAAVAEAAERGAVAVVMYRDGGGLFKEGVERGSVGRGVLGGGRKRMQRIPSMPVSEEMAEMVLERMGGRRVFGKWEDGGGVKRRGWRVGPGPGFINFSYEGENRWSKVKNVFATIKGREEPDRYILLGNHRDAWTYGAVDPNSGTSVLLDIARRYSHLLGQGWRPRRTIVFCSWDAEEFGMVGSTEWVGKNLVKLMSSAVAYINVDCAVQGDGFFASATPQLDDLLIDVTKKVMDPDSKEMTVYEKWVALNGRIHIQRLAGIDSDFAPFIQLAGVPAMDLYFGKDYPVYHTNFDTYEWMIKYGDPLFRRHVAVAEIWGLIGLHLADDPILPFNYSSYVQLLSDHTEEIRKKVGGNASLLLPLSHAIGELKLAVKEIEEMAKRLASDDIHNTHLLLKRRILNDRLMLAERGFLDYTKRRFKHLIFGPYGAHGSKAGVFPGLSEAVNGKENDEKQIIISHEIQRIAAGVKQVASVLRGDIS